LDKTQIKPHRLSLHLGQDKKPVPGAGFT
jgi:hypothetical protein